MALHKIDAKHTATNAAEQYILEIDAKHGSTHETSFYNVKGKLVVLNNNNNSGVLGSGSELTGKTITIRSNAENNTPDMINDEDQITIEYYVAGSINRTKIAVYDKPEEEDDYPTIKLKIIFE